VTPEVITTLTAKIDACLLLCEPIESDMRSSDAVATTFERLSLKGKKTWQQQKRHVHQPQLESMIAHIEEECHDTSIVAELGAGKGMFGRLLSEIIGAATVAVERRHVGTQVALSASIPISRRLSEDLSKDDTFYPQLF